MLLSPHQGAHYTHPPPRPTYESPRTHTRARERNIACSIFYYNLIFHSDCIRGRCGRSKPSIMCWHCSHHKQLMDTVEHVCARAGVFFHSPLFNKTDFANSIYFSASRFGCPLVRLNYVVATRDENSLTPTRCHPHLNSLVCVLSAPRGSLQIAQEIVVDEPTNPICSLQNNCTSKVISLWQLISSPIFLTINFEKHSLK